MLEKDNGRLGRMAVLVLKKFAFPTADLVDFAAAEEAMVSARLSADYAPLPDRPTCLAAHAAAQLIVNQDHILPDGSPRLRHDRLTRLGFTYIEGCALQLALMIVEALRQDPDSHAKLTYDTRSNSPAVERFRDALRPLDSATRPHALDVPDIVAVLQELTSTAGPVERPVQQSRSIGGVKPRWRFAFVYLLVPMFVIAALGVALWGSRYSIVADGERDTPQPISTATPTPTVTGADSVYRGPRLPNAKAELSVYPLESPPTPKVWVTSGLEPTLQGQPLVVRLGQTLTVELSLSHRDSAAPADRSLNVSIGTEPGTEIIGGRTVLFNEANPEIPIPVRDLGNTYTAVTLDENDVPTVIKFEVRIADPSAAEPASFFCGYNLRPIRAFLTAGDLAPVVTTFPFYVLRECP